MKVFLVPKKLEGTPLIRGLKPRYYYLVFSMLILGGLFLAPFLLNLLGSGGGGFSGLIIYIVFWLGSLYFLNSYLKKKSKAVKYQFKKKRIVVSNKDLYNYL